MKEIATVVVVGLLSIVLSGIMSELTNPLRGWKAIGKEAEEYAIQLESRSSTLQCSDGECFVVE